MLWNPLVGSNHGPLKNRSAATMTNPGRRYPALLGIVFLVALMAARGADAKRFFCGAGDVLSDSVDQRGDY
jgi:hypothetical protein